MAAAVALPGCRGDETVEWADTASSGTTGGSAEGGDTEGGEPGAHTRLGRTPRRLSADQVRAALTALTGQTYRGGASVLDPLHPQGEVWRDDADLLDVFAGALGRPDYDYTVTEVLEMSMTFAKFVQDAGRYACREAVVADIAAPPESRRILLRVGPDDTLASAEAAVRDNIGALALRFWARELAPDSPEVDELVALFNAAASAPAWTDKAGTTRPAGTPADGWRVVCIALATDAQFYVY